MTKRKHTETKSVDVHQPTPEEMDQKLYEVIDNGKKNGWYMVIAEQDYEKNEYIGPVDFDTANEIVDCEMYCRGMTKTVYQLTSLPIDQQYILPYGHTIAAMVFTEGTEGGKSYGPFNDTFGACEAVSKQGATDDKIRDVINRSNLYEVCFYPGILLKYPPGSRTQPTHLYK